MHRASLRLIDGNTNEKKERKEKQVYHPGFIPTGSAPTAWHHP
jgi:hypothetical protein